MRRNSSSERAQNLSRKCQPAPLALPLWTLPAGSEGRRPRDFTPSERSWMTQISQTGRRCPEASSAAQAPEPIPKTVRSRAIHRLVRGARRACIGKAMNRLTTNSGIGKAMNRLTPNSGQVDGKECCGISFGFAVLQPPRALGGSCRGSPARKRENQEPSPCPAVP
jgi:hypothetical protein